MDLKKSDTALVVIEPQNDVLSEKGGSWPLVGDSVKENNTVEKMMLDGKEFWRPVPSV